MGLFHEVALVCPSCGQGITFQSKELDGMERHEQNAVPKEIAHALMDREPTCRCSSCNTFLTIVDVTAKPDFLSLRLVEL